MSSYQFGQFSEEHLEKSREGVELFNQQLYWECHESLEHVWLEDRGDNARYIYWAIIQVAASMIHYRNKNLIGAQGMISKAKEKFKYCHTHNVLTDLVENRLSWSELEAMVMEVPENAPLEAFAKLFDFRFTKM